MPHLLKIMAKFVLQRLTGVEHSVLKTEIAKKSEVLRARVPWSVTLKLLRRFEAETPRILIKC
jgi:hypothetical protein